MLTCTNCGKTFEEDLGYCPSCESPMLEEETSEDTILAKYEGALIADRYKILSRLGIGGMGGVYKALDEELNEIIAIKILRAELQMDSQSLQRFKLETKTTRKLRHPNIVGMFDLYWGEDLKFITMELVEGITLRSFLKEHKTLPIPQAINLTVQILRALEEAHRQGVTHRDIKPGNIMLIQEDGTDGAPVFSVKVADFGIAKITSEEGGVTTAGLIIGTPEYMSPEQAEGLPVGTQSDIYSLGIMLYEMLVGKVPFKADTPMATAIKHITDTPPPLRQFCPNAPERLERLVMKMVAKRPEDRWKTVGEIRELLEKRTSLFITSEDDLVAQMPSEMERIRRFEQTQEVKRKEELEAKRVAKKVAPPSRAVRPVHAFPWKPIAVITVLIAIVGAAFVTYKYRLISLNKMALPDLKKIVPGGKGMVLIPEGEFLMGTTKSAAERISEIFPKSKESWIKDEQPAHRVYLKAFSIDRHEVTNQEYKKFVDATGHRVPLVEEEWAEGYNWEQNTYPPGKEDHPVVLVSWEDAQAYAQWAGKRLPTEAEWEKAARGGLEDRLWPWGDEWDPTRINSWESDIKGTQPVKSYPPNEYGLYDMAGNVWEWCADWYGSDYYQSSPTHEPQGSDSGINRLARGGSWSNMAFTSRCGERKKMNPKTQFNSIGFRCVKDK